MQKADWLVVLIPVVAIVVIALKTRRYVKGVSDFLAAGRSAGRYLVCNAEGTAAMGVISFIAYFEMLYKAGFAVTWWQRLQLPVSLLMTLTGFVIYRYRATRALTMAQFFEMRYSRRFRVFMGLAAVTSGILNYGIFPAVAGRFFVYYCGLPEQVVIGAYAVPTFAVVMALQLGLAVSFACVGGQLTAMVTDCIEGLISGVLFLVVAITVLAMFGWDRIADAMRAVPAGHSLLNPFDAWQVQDFNLWFVLIGVFAAAYTCMAWQGNQGFNASALSPHEAKMGKILGAWRGYARLVMIYLVAVAAYAFMHHPDFTSGADAARQVLDKIESPTIRTQMTVPVAMSFYLPTVVRGCFAAIMLFAVIAADTSYLHSWGSIFIQDVVLPFRRTHLSPQSHLRWLRWAIGAVSVFAFWFSLLFRQTDYVFMYFAITGAIYLGGAGSAIIGGLYWSRGTTAAAWVAMLTGSGLAVGGLLAQQLIPGFPINGQYLNGMAMVAAVVVYGVVSLLTNRQPFDMDKLLHRGPYALDEQGRPLPAVPKPPRTWQSLIGIDENFTRGDRLQSVFLFWWGVLWFAVFLLGTGWNLIAVWPPEWWSAFWYYTGILLPIVIGVVTTVWFTWGGIRDLHRLFARLRASRPDAADDGTVEHTPIAQPTTPTKSGCREVR